MSSSEKIVLSSVNYLHEKADESRHNETLAFLILTIGTVFFVGGLLETVITTENPDWFLFFPYKIAHHSYSLLGLSLELSGFTLLVLGIILGIHYARDRRLYMNLLKKAYAEKVSKTHLREQMETLMNIRTVLESTSVKRKLSRKRQRSH